MVVLGTSPASLALSKLVRAKTDTAKQQKRCREGLRAAIADASRERPHGKAACQLIVAECRSCGRCIGI